jgi:uncharacterized membrane protein
MNNGKIKKTNMIKECFYFFFHSSFFELSVFVVLILFVIILFIYNDIKSQSDEKENKTTNSDDVVSVYYDSGFNDDINSDERVLEEGEYLIPEGLFEYDRVTIILN